MPNVPPTINEIRGPLEPVAVNEEAVIAVSFFDPNAGDTHEALVNWGDGTRTSPPIDIGDLVFTDTHPYASSGIFSVVASITDLAGASDTVKFEPVIVYDPDGGFVTGGGWIDSPAGAYQIDPELTGKATFGFVSKYKKNASAPSGLARFRLKAANLNFRSKNHEWLVVPGDDTALLQGTGTINRKVAPNGQPYRFMVWAKDGVPDTLRIKIWYEESGGEVIVYDNGAKQPIGHGSITIHKGRKS